MARLPKCKWCKETIEDKANTVKKSNGWWHNDCLKEKEKQKNENKSDYDKLIDYIYELYNGHIPVFIFKQIKDYVNEYGMKYSGILLTLKYIYEELEIPFDEENGIGLVVYKYSECSKEWQRQQEINKAIEEFEFEENEVVVNKKINNKQWSKVKEINMEDEETIYG